LRASTPRFGFAPRSGITEEVMAEVVAEVIEEVATEGAVGTVEGPIDKEEELVDAMAEVDTLDETDEDVEGVDEEELLMRRTEGGV